MFLDYDQVHLDLEELRNHVRSSKVVVLVLTQETLHSAFCLLEIFTALKNGIPVVIAEYSNRKVENEAIIEYFTFFDQRADSKLIDQLRSFSVDPIEAAYLFSTNLTQIIRKEYNPAAARRVQHSMLIEIVKAIKVAKPPILTTTSFEWLRKRGDPGV